MLIPRETIVRDELMNATPPKESASMSKQNIATISLDTRSRDTARESLTALIGDFFSFTSYTLEEYKSLHNPQDEFVLITARFLVNSVSPFLPLRCKYFAAKREIDPKSLHKLLGIPKGSRVLMVNNSIGNAVEVINEIRALDIEDIEMTPYGPESELSGTYDMAITTGQVHLVPQSISTIIDLGLRPISLMTIAELFFYFQQGQVPDAFITQRYTKDLLATAGDLYEKQRKNLRLQNYMQMLLSNFDDGILATDSEGVILFHNKMASMILENGELIGHNLRDVDANLAASDEETAFVKIRDEIVYVTRQNHVTDDGEDMNIITLKNTSQISEIDNKFAKYKKNSGHTAKFVFKDIVFSSPAMRDIITIAERIATKEAGILITGESGTGKELFAQAVHNGSQRKDGPFVALNCAALSESLLESELFGYEEGAFTGATKGGKKGLFEVANGGTIFLDEIGDAPLSIQLKMLRVLQEREVMRVAANRVIPINVRVIAATNKDLPSQVRTGRFREDLFFRLNVINLHIPPLRERFGDIELLLNLYLNRFGCSINKLDQASLNLLTSYSWPGNIRELKNIAEYIATIYDITPNLLSSLRHTLLAEGHQQPRSVTEDGLGTFRNPSVKKDLDAILVIFADAKRDSFNLGRDKIQAILKEQGTDLSIQQIKTRIDILKKHGYVESFVGRGSQITPAGEAYIQGKGA